MSYIALYRKWRPDEFDEVKGQEHVVTTLKNQIIHNRIGHAYLFCGTRGTGKTTVAKLFAKAVNCEHPRADGSPCNECPTCKAISVGNSMNVIEIDAASNNGVDNIREIKESVMYSPAEGKYKVYIIDEVHMLSIGAFNALLKTLEEPPAYVIFILATTESHKIPITILSRCQRYDFRRISMDVIADRLSDLMKRENVPAEDKAVKYVAKAADGSMRDALSLLDQCIAFYLGEELTYEKVIDVLGAVDIDVFSRLMQAIASRDPESAVKIIDEIVWQGRELGQFVTDFTWYMRNILLIKTSSDASDSLDLSKENIELLKVVSEQVDLNSLMRYIRIFSEMSNTIRYATQKRVVLELAVIKLCIPSMDQDTESILDRIRALEDDFDKKIKEAVAQAEPVARVVQSTESVENDILLNPPQADKADIAAVVADKIDFLNCLRNIDSLLFSAAFKDVRESDITATESGVNIVMPDEHLMKRVDRTYPMAEIRKAIILKYRKEIKVTFSVRQYETKKDNAIVNSINMDVEINN